MKKWGTLFLSQLLMLGMLACNSPQSSNSNSNSDSNPTPAKASEDAKENPSASKPSIKFISFGDWGTGDANQIAVANQIQQSCQTQACDFGLLLGDNFYPHGVINTSDPQWQNKYRALYGKLNLSFYALLGNHDWDSPAVPQAQIDYSSQDSSWKMPSAFHTQSFPNNSEPLLQIFMLNSNDFKTNSAQQNWLRDQLAQSSAPWKIVAFHHPIYTNSASHPPDQKDIYPLLKPLICGKVDLLLSGHDHLFSHLRNSAENCGYDQVIIGTGGRHLYNSSGQGGLATILYTESQFGFGHFSLTSNQMALQFIRSDGQVGYSYQWQK